MNKQAASSTNVSPGDVIELNLTDMAHGGEALGRLDGQVCFVPYTLPGETVRARILESHRSYLRAELVEVLTPSPDRVEPPCAHFGVCGGCQWQHIAYPAQLAYKREILQGQLAHIAKLELDVAPTLGMETPWHYRNNVRFSIDNEGNLGYLAARSHEVVAIQECYLPHPLIEEMLLALDLAMPNLRRLSLRAGINTEDLMLILEGQDDDLPELEVDLPISCVWLPQKGAPITMAGRSALYEKIAGRTYRISADSFFQVNTVQAERLVQLVQQGLDPRSDDLVLDLYCGVGTFGLALADQVEAVIGVEESPGAIYDAMENAQQQENVTLIHGPVEAILDQLPPQIDLAIIDPPRTGVKAETLQALAATAPRRIAYVSCDPASLARDLAKLVAAGYAVVHVQPVDMFPQTYHIETLALLERT